MRHHDHGLGAVGLVIAVHVGSMYLSSVVTGVPVDRLGPVPVAVAGGVNLLLAGITAESAPADSLGGLIVALALLGLGWKLGLISGMAFLVDATTPQGRARTQGTRRPDRDRRRWGRSHVEHGHGEHELRTLSIAGRVMSLLLITVQFRAWNRQTERDAPT